MPESLSERLANRRQPGDAGYDAFYDASDRDLAAMVPPRPVSVHEQVAEHLRGPWSAYLMTFDEETFTDPAAVPEDAAEPAIIVLRGSEIPVDGRIPEGAADADVLYAISPDDVSDWAAQLPARWAQAQAVAEALNALPGQPSNEPGA